MEKVTIKAKQVKDKIGYDKIVYKKRNEVLSEILFPYNGFHFTRDKYVVCCAYTKHGTCLSFEYDTLERAVEKTDFYINNIYQGNCEIIKSF